MNNNMSWLNLGNYINPKARNTELSNDYNQLTNRPIITLTGTSQNPIKLWKLDVGLYILNGYVQHTDALLSEARGLFVSATVGIVNGKYVISAFIPFWEGQYEYILPSLSSETYTEHQMIRMITQGNSLTLDNIREYFPTQDYHPTTKKYVDETMDAIRNELNKMGLNNNDVQSLIKENRRRDIAIQALLSQNSDKMVTINEEVHNISMDYSLDKGIATINTLEGDTLVNVSKDTEYDKILSYEQDIVENTNTVDLEVDGNLNPIIVGDTLVNVCTQNNPTAITNEYTVEGNNHFALQDEVEGNCRPIIQGHTLVNYCTNGSEELTLNNEINVQGTNITLTDTVDNGKVDVVCEGNTLVNLATSENFIAQRLTMNGCRFTITSFNNYGYLDIPLEKLSLFKSNGRYKVIVNITKNTLQQEGGTQSAFQMLSYNYNGYAIESSTNGNYSVQFQVGEVGIKECIITMKDFDNPSNPISKGVIHFESSYYATSGELEGYIIICEYNENTQYPTLPFEGMKSAFELEDNKVEIVSGDSDNTLSNTHSIQLSEPLRGISDEVCDKFVKQGGKWYVERNCGEINLANISFNLYPLSDEYPDVLGFHRGINNSKHAGGLICNVLPHMDTYIPGKLDRNFECIDINSGYIKGAIYKSKLTELTKEGLQKYFKNVNAKIVYQLATPTYEEITDSQVITYLDTTHISNNSTIPCTMQVKNSGYNAIIKPSTQYTVALNANINEEINVDLGGTEVTTTNNVITITTPNTLTNENLMLYGKNVVINNAMLFEGDMTSNLPSEYIEGLKSSFEDGYIPELENLTIKNTVDITPKTYIQIISLYGNATQNMGLMHTKDETFTIVGKVIKTNDFNGNISIRLYNGETGVGNKIFYIDNYFITLVSAYTYFNRIAICVNSFTSGSAKVENIKVFKGDWTHLTEEDFNHLGQYKVGYKVTGKNKFKGELINNKYSSQDDVCERVNNQDGSYNIIPQNVIQNYFSGVLNVNVIPNKTYKISYKVDNVLVTPSVYVYKGFNNVRNTSMQIASTGNYGKFTVPKGVTQISVGLHYNKLTEPYTISDIQIEEGTVATEYEPYKESIQTVYLNSPLLEGDTIEEIDGEVYHVHRYYKTILNGNEYWDTNTYTQQHENTDCIVRYSSRIVPDIKSNGKVKCDKVTGCKSFSINYPSINDLTHDGWAWYLILSKNKLSTPDTNGFKQWLQENPITVVYELASPIYELIPSSSIVCKSYPNGHLDFDTNVHINNTVNFVKANLPITYANTSTNYKLQFVSDKDMENVTINILGNIMENVTITKGLNKISFTSPSDATNILTFEGIGYAYISNVQLVATDKDINYFKGLYSTYECGLIEDESNENYGKYEVNIVSYNAPIQFGKGGKIE